MPAPMAQMRRTTGKSTGALPEVWARKTVAEKLAHANEYLKEFKLELFVWDAYRPVRCQQGLWDYFTRQAAQKMPAASEEERRQWVLTFVSDPTNFKNDDAKTWPSHACGGAVDMTLRKIDGELLDMGAAFDQMDEMASSDAFERMLAAGEIAEDDQRLWNRRLLHWTVIREGFINYRHEFWHFDYGDQMFVMHANELNLPVAPSAAWYGYIDPPEQV